MHDKREYNMRFIGEKNTNKSEMPLHFLGAAYINGFFWTSALEWNGYYRLNAETGAVEFLGLFDHADVWADKLYYQVIAYQKFVYFIPWFSNYLVRLDIESLHTKYWKLPESLVMEIAKFRAANLYDGKIIMFPHVGSDICIFDLEKEEFRCDRNWLADFSRLATGNIKDKFSQSCQRENITYLASLAGSFMVKYNLHSYECEMIPFPEGEKKIVDIVEYGREELLVLTWVGNVWRYHLNSKRREVIYNYGGEIECPYRHVLVIQKHLLLIPANEMEIKVLNETEEGVIPYPSGWKIHYIDTGVDCIFNGYYRDNNQILLFPCKGNMLLRLNENSTLSDGVIICDDTRSRAEEIDRYLNHRYAEIFMEQQRIDLRFFMDIVIAERSSKKENQYINKNGQLIWNMMK